MAVQAAVKVPLLTRSHAAESSSGAAVTRPMPSCPRSQALLGVERAAWPSRAPRPSRRGRRPAPRPTAAPPCPGARAGRRPGRARRASPTSSTTMIPVGRVRAAPAAARPARPWRPRTAARAAADRAGQRDALGVGERGVERRRQEGQRPGGADGGVLAEARGGERVERPQRAEEREVRDHQRPDEGVDPDRQEEGHDPRQEREEGEVGVDVADLAEVVLVAEAGHVEVPGGVPAAEQPERVRHRRVDAALGQPEGQAEDERQQQHQRARRAPGDQRRAPAGAGAGHGERQRRPHDRAPGRQPAHVTAAPMAATAPATIGVTTAAGSRSTGVASRRDAAGQVDRQGDVGVEAGPQRPRPARARRRRRRAARPSARSRRGRDPRRRPGPPPRARPWRRSRAAARARPRRRAPGP